MRKDKDYRLRNDKFVPEWHMYKLHDKEELGEHIRRFHFFHFVLKYKLFVPLLKVYDWLVNKRLVKVECLPKQSHNKLLFVFNDVFEQSLKDWCTNYRCRGTCFINSLKTRDKKLSDGSSNLLRSIHKLLSNLYFYDTAYREFFNILLFNTVKEFNKKYKGDKELDVPLYLSNGITDVNYVSAYDYLWKKHFENKDVQPGSNSFDVPGFNPLTCEFVKGKTRLTQKFKWDKKCQAVRVNDKLYKIVIKNGEVLVIKK